jgi:DNA polymerase I-like protein with 3'-5' exonuclease and polymerase domains
MKSTFEPMVINRVSEKTGKPLKPKIIEFNPSSRQQIGDRLILKYGWKPKEYTANGQPKIDEVILKALDYPEAQDLAEYFMLEKRVGQLAEGDNAWLKLERNGIIHGSYNTNGAVTGRATHQSPNLAQVPSVRSPYGTECRSLFTVRSGFSMVGCDLSGLELRCLAHYMSKWDDGEYTEELLNGDIHTKNQKAAGLPTRDNAKTFIYSFLYGAGDEKIGAVVGAGAREGKRLKEAFLSATPALAKLRDAVAKASSRGYLIGLDGRKLHVRSEHAALNTLLQSAGALISKQWLIEIDKTAAALGLEYGKDWSMLGWIHDEVQIQVKGDYAETFGEKVVTAAEKAGEFFEFRCPISAEFKIGQNWYDTH